MLNVSAVSFGNSDPIISREGKYTQNSQQPTVLQTPLDSFDTSEKKHKGLKVSGALAVLAAAAGGLVWAYKAGKLPEIKLPEKISEQAKNYADAARKIFTDAYDNTVSWCAGMINKVKGQ